MAHSQLEESERACIKKPRDDHNRYVTGSQIFRDGTAENIIRLLDRAIHEQAKPREILNDHGSQFWGVGEGESSFDAYCKQQRIKHMPGGVGKPTGELSTQCFFSRRVTSLISIYSRLSNHEENFYV